MKCPFDLPVYKDEWAVTSFCIRNSKGILFTSGIPEASADYIVHVVNSHKKLVEAFKKYGDHEPGCIKGDACNCGFEQALEAEK